jgi:hypothetical protein
MSEYSDWLVKCHKVVLYGTPLPDDDLEELLFLLDAFAPAVAWCQEHLGATFRPDSWPGSGHGLSWHARGAEFYFAETKDAMEFMMLWG